MTENLIHWSDEAQLLGYGESDSTGAWLKFRVNPEDLEEFRGLKGTVFYLTVIQMDAEGKPVARTAAVDAPVEPEKPAQPAHEYGQQASDLYRNGFFLVPDVLRAIGTDEEFLEWVRQQPCCLYGKKWEPDHAGDVVAAHVRRIANGAGTSIKPEYSAVPLCDRHHKLQHQSGESAIGSKELLDRLRNRYLQVWAAHKLASDFGKDSIGDVDPRYIRDWAGAVDIEKWLPTVYRNA